MRVKHCKKLTANDDDDDALFRETVHHRKCLITFFQPASLPGVLALSNFRNITSKIWVYAERRFWIYWTRMCNSDNHYNTIPFIVAFDNLTVFVFYRLVMVREKNQTETYQLFDRRSTYVIFNCKYCFDTVQRYVNIFYYNVMRDYPRIASFKEFIYFCIYVMYFWCWHIIPKT